MALRMLRWRTPRQALDLAISLAKKDDIEGACAAFQRAIDSGHPDISPAAACRAGGYLHRAGDDDRARSFFQLAIDSRHHNWAPKAASDLGQLLETQGDLDGARRQYELAIDLQHPLSDEVWAHRAAIKLEIMLTQQGDTAGAERVRNRATDGGQLDKQVRFAYNRATELHTRGEIEAAAASYQEVIDSASDQAPTAAFTLGCLLEDHGDLDGARAAFQVAIDSSHPTVAPQAKARLRDLDS